MEVELDKALIDARPAESLLLLALCAFGALGRHRVRPDDRARWERWVSALPADLAEEVRNVWDEGERRSAVGGPAERVRVQPIHSPVFAQEPILVGPVEALALLGQPLRVFLENGRNDRAFLLAFADEATRRALEDAESEGWLVFETAGGIGELRIRIEAACDEAREPLRTMYLCDSDATEPESPSEAAASVRRHLRRMERRFNRPPPHFGLVLARRAAENYCPPGAVLLWASGTAGSDAWRLIRDAGTEAGRTSLAIGPGTAGSARRHLLAAIALKELPEEVRGVLDMKEGRGTADRRRTADSVWDRLDSFQKAALADGFGSSFSAKFYSTQRNLCDETGEISGFLSKILERL